MNLKDRISIKKLHELTGLELLEDRFTELGGRYLKNAIENENPLICELIEEFKRFSGGRNLKCKSLLCDKNIY